MEKPDRCVIQVGGEDVGVLVKERNAFVLHTLHSGARSLDQQAFRSIRAAEDAVRKALQPAQQ